MGSLVHTPEGKTKQVELQYMICHQPHPSSEPFDVMCLKKNKNGPQCPCHPSPFHGSILLLASDDMSKSKELVLRLFVVPCLLKGHLKLSATASWSEGLWERVWTKPKREALLGTVDFFEIPLNASYIPPQPTFAPLLQHKVLTDATHYQRMNLTPVWVPLHELIEQKVTARMELLIANGETIPFFPNHVGKLGHHTEDKQL